MDKNLFASFMKRHGDTQQILAEEMGISLSRLNAKINETGGAQFGSNEIQFIAKRYRMKAKDIVACFFAQKVS